MLHWLVEDFASDNSTSILIEEIKRQGYPCEVIRYIPFSGVNSHETRCANETCVVVYGSIQLCKRLQREQPHWMPGPMVTWNNYRCCVYYAYYGAYLFNSIYTMLPFAELIRRKEEFFERYDGAFFMRPDDGAKSFTGTLVQPRSLEGNSLIKLQCETTEESLIVVAAPRLINREWRLVCSHTDVITGSRYKTNEMVDIRAELPDEVKALGEKILKETTWRPDPVFTLDICQARDELFLLEIGAFSYAGLYQCDFEKIVSQVSAIAIKEFEDFNEH